MKKFFKSCYFLIIMLFIYIPIATMIFLSFNNGKNVDDFTGFSFKWYEYLINYSPFIKSITVSLFVAMISTIISIIVGVMACYGLSRIKRKTANRWVRIANIPLVNADVITAVSLMIIFVLAGIKFGIVTLIAAHISFNIPYVIVTVLPFMNRIDKNLVDASNDLGASSKQTFFKVILPILLPSIITATAICFAMSFDDFIISYFTGGDQTNVSTFIYTAKKITPYINAFGTILVVTIVFIILVWNAIQITLQSIKENKQKLKKGTYRLKDISSIEKRIIYYKKCIETESKIFLSLNPLLWLKYKFLQMEYKRLSNKSLDSKISKLEWKKELLVEKINDDSRALSILERLENKKAILKQKTNLKKVKNLDLILSSLDKKIQKYQSKVDLINERKLKSEQDIIELQNDIKILKTDLSNEKEPNEKLVSWYNNKIKDLEVQINILKEGKNKYKLKQTIDKLSDLKTKQEQKLINKYEELQIFKRKVKRVVPFGHNLDKSLIKNSSNKEMVSYLKDKKHNLTQKEIAKYTSLIQNNDTKLEKLLSKILDKKEKYFPSNISETVNVKNNVWVKRNWKKVLMSTSVLAAFSLLTTAYALNNVYDLVIGNWGSYIAPGVIEEFEKKEGVRINYQQYDSNESLYNKIYTFNYDAMVPSEYMVKKLAEEDKLQKIDYNCIKTINLPNGVVGENGIEGIVPKGVCQFDSIENQENVEKPYDIDKDLVTVLRKTVIGSGNDVQSLFDYSINWFWGDVRLAFNIGTDDQQPRQELIEFMDKHDLFIKESKDEKSSLGDNPFEWKLNTKNLSWDILWDAAKEGFDLKLNEDPKNVFMYAFERLYGQVDANGDSIKLSSAQKQEWIDAAANEVQKLLSYNNVGLYGDNIMDAVHAKNYDIAVIYNGDLLWATAPDYESEDAEDEDTTPTDDSNNDTDTSGSDESEEENSWVYTTLSGTPQYEHPGDNKDPRNFKEGTNVWSDNLVISKDNRNLELTYKFINFMYTYDIQMRQAEEATAATIMGDVNEQIANEGEDPWSEWFHPEVDGAQPFGFDEKMDNYLVDKFNQIISTKH
ncbi:spermidine/putrescine ABC transporter permease [Spiroplasma corruscae]|uniref:Spermidine/putrescine ABC transporter permease n=1 Tax=Spiroplasma corruscae TaxID=216934 RepID=A0A222EN09_9MOLU|nr:spermidine/putrescine ABC transporter permease/substrate-binding protein [Spiroplasma corruscae]ASP27897.1 spermidine/putrescine ABC transporter permease [Spiroplasma corruscae]